jgi:hypothetical protein
MYQSSARKNFLDILLDPTAIAILASLALHTIIGAGLPFFTRPEPEGKKSGPTTVKVVELTPSELQRIPQAPPVPTPQVPPPTQRVAPSPPTAAPPRVTKFSTAPQTIPFSPLRPSDGTLFKPKTAKPKKAAPPKQPLNPLFDPNAIFNSPTTAPKPQNKKGVTTKPSPKTSSPVVTKPPTKAPTKAPQKLVTPQPNTETDDDGGNTPPAQTPPASNPNNRQAQQPAGTKPATNTNPNNSTSTTPTEPANTGGDGNGFYGKYTRAANAKLQDYLKKYPNLKTYPPKLITQQYPPSFPCPKVKQPPFIVLMVAFGKLSQAQDPIIGETISPILENEKPYVNGDPATLANKKLLDTSMTAGFADATEVDKSRPASDKDRPVLYPYRVQFTCKP